MLTIILQKMINRIYIELGNGFYAIQIVGKDAQKLIQKINDILKPIVTKHRNDLEYIIMQKSIDLGLLNKRIEGTKNIILKDAEYQIKTLQEEALKIFMKIEQIIKVLVEKDEKKNPIATYITQIGGSDYELSSLIQYRNDMITNLIPSANTKLFDIQMLLENFTKQKNDLEDDIKNMYIDTRIVSIFTTVEKNKNLLIIAILGFIGLFVSIFSVLVWDVVKKHKK